MPRSPESRGTCSFCDEVVTKRGVVKHLEKCSSPGVVSINHLLV